MCSGLIWAVLGNLALAHQNRNVVLVVAQALQRRR